MLQEKISTLSLAVLLVYKKTAISLAVTEQADVPLLRLGLA
jgi:hypothetical protein